MDEVETTVAIEQETDTPQTSPQEEIAQEPQIESKQDRNWREMRRINADLEKKSRQQEELIATLLKQQVAAQPIHQPDEMDAVPDEDYIPKGQVKKLLKKEREEMKKEAREEAQRLLAEQERANFHGRLKTRYSDFDEVVTPETLELLEQEDPELAATIMDLKDPYKMGLQTYKYIKSLGLSAKAPVQKRAKEVDKKLEQNAKTVQSPLAYDKRPMAQTFRMTDQIKQELYKEMMEYSKMAPSVPSL